VPASDGDGTVTVRMSGFRSSAGKVIVVIHDHPEGFPGDEPLHRARASIKDGAATVRFTGLRDGAYAVSMFHDENDNGILDETWVGRPKEGVGASNNPQPKLRAPNFAESSFALAGKHTALILVRYL
jgi:uncharacterized protein (DUF2141 family)